MGSRPALQIATDMSLWRVATDHLNDPNATSEVTPMRHPSCAECHGAAVMARDQHQRQRVACRIPLAHVDADPPRVALFRAFVEEMNPFPDWKHQ